MGLLSEVFIIREAPAAGKPSEVMSLDQLAQVNPEAHKAWTSTRVEPEFAGFMQVGTQLFGVWDNNCYLQLEVFKNGKWDDSAMDDMLHKGMGKKLDPMYDKIANAMHKR